MRPDIASQKGTLGRVPSFSRKQRLLLAVVPRPTAILIRVLGSTWRVKDIAAPETQPGHLEPGPTIFAFWHESLLSCAWRFRGLGIAILISRSFDGELIARTVEHLGFFAVRGSSSRGGAVGLRGMAAAFQEGHICAFTADGPRGPRRIAKPGPVQLAEHVEASWIGCFHAEPDRTWRLRSWDRFAIPKPFATIHFGWPTHVAVDVQALRTGLSEATRLAEASGREGADARL